MWAFCARVLAVEVDSDVLVELIHAVAVRRGCDQAERLRDDIVYWVLQILNQDLHFARVSLLELEGISEGERLRAALGVASEHIRVRSRDTETLRVCLIKIDLIGQEQCDLHVVLKVLHLDRQSVVGYEVSPEIAGQDAILCRVKLADLIISHEHSRRLLLEQDPGRVVNVVLYRL